ncbi:NAD(P)H-dependent oxidoreductase [Sodalis ligni]|uniref:FMN-dependent NADH-azoreductase n=1 Tax=Sodalis ligni TaxID=2697027 RepID=UPI00194005F1|nr:NAD(P)H-dependent oxidoreductase [Sodalis ligni]QWA12068.1 NAD(P)H-dependent oxidoreductase [Sodalis ligni]
MSTLLYLECSPHAGHSLGARLARGVIDDITSRHPDVGVVTRSLVLDPLPPLSARYAQGITASSLRDDEAFTCSEHLIDELERSEGLLISTPMHNFAVPAALKLWLDYVLRKDRSFKTTPQGKVGTLRDRPTLVLVRSGGPCTGENARQPDFLTPYLHYARSALGIGNVNFVYLPGLSPSEEDLELTRCALAAVPLL